MLLIILQRTGRALALLPVPTWPAARAALCLQAAHLPPPWGPPTSFPTGMPLPSPAVRATTLATKALRVRYSFRITPRSIVFISGIPDPKRMTKRIFVGSRQAKREMNTRTGGPGDGGGERAVWGRPWGSRCRSCAREAAGPKGQRDNEIMR